MESNEFKQLREQKEPFLREINPTIERLYAWVKSFSSTAIISDTSGYILERIGDPAFMKDTDKIHLFQGACWSETVRGTNAVGTVIIEKKPLAVVGQDHYLEANRYIYCAASPIFDPLGEQVAVLDISGYYNIYHPSILAMVDVIARKVEDWILIHDSNKQLVISLHPQQKRGQGALLRVNEEGVITGANREARDLFELDQLLLNAVKLSEFLTGVESLLQRPGNHPNSDVSAVYNRKDDNNKWFASVLVDKRPLSVAFTQDRKTSLPSVRRSSVKYTFADIYGNDPDFLSVLELAKRAAKTDYNILVTGESGTGKEMVSQAIHHVSNRSDKPFVALNCGAIARTLMESELFGYEAGAFTGAKQSGHPGKIELAHGGTLFLDEIAEMPLEMQVSLLRVLQEKTVIRVGGIKPIQVDVRIIAATHKDLWEEVQAGRFRADLFYRLQGIHLVLPPLRDRKDRLDLAAHLLRAVVKELGSPMLSFSEEATKLINQYSWPGNVRELLGSLRQAAFLATDGIIDIRHFPAYILKNRAPYAETASASLEQLEHETILRILNTTDGNISQAARMLGIGRNTLYRKLKKLNRTYTTQ